MGERRKSTAQKRRLVNNVVSAVKKEKKKKKSREKRRILSLQDTSLFSRCLCPAVRGISKQPRVCGLYFGACLHPRVVRAPSAPAVGAALGGRRLKQADGSAARVPVRVRCSRPRLGCPLWGPGWVSPRDLFAKGPVEGFSRYCGHCWV